MLTVINAADDEDETEWIPFKHVDTIELSDESSDDEPFEVYDSEG